MAPKKAMRLAPLGFSWRRRQGAASRWRGPATPARRLARSTSPRAGRWRTLRRHARGYPQANASSTPSFDSLTHTSLRVSSSSTISARCLPSSSTASYSRHRSQMCWPMTLLRRRVENSTSWGDQRGSAVVGVGGERVIGGQREAGVANRPRVMSHAPEHLRDGRIDVVIADEAHGLRSAVPR